VDPATNETGFVPLELAAGLQIVTDGLVGFREQGAAHADVASVNSRKNPKQLLNSSVLHFMPHPTPSSARRKLLGIYAKWEMHPNSSGLLLKQSSSWIW